MLLSTCCEDDVVPHVLPFIREHIENPDWRYRDASVMAFGSILEGPELSQLKTLVLQVGAPPTTHPPNLSIKLRVLTIAGPTEQQEVPLVRNDSWSRSQPQYSYHGITRRKRVASMLIHNEAKSLKAQSDRIT